MTPVMMDNRLLIEKTYGKRSLAACFVLAAFMPVVLGENSGNASLKNKKRIKFPFGPKGRDKFIFGNPCSGFFSKGFGAYFPVPHYAVFIMLSPGNP